MNGETVPFVMVVGDSDSSIRLLWRTPKPDVFLFFPLPSTIGSVGNCSPFSKDPNARFKPEFRALARSGGAVRNVDSSPSKNANIRDGLVVGGGGDFDIANWRSRGEKETRWASNARVAH